MDKWLELTGVVPLPNRPARPGGGPLSVHSIDLAATRGSGLSVFAFDDFRVRGHPFGPHPHAGFSAVTYVLEDSQSGLRSRDSLGNDIVVGPGGMVWTQAASGALHEELPATFDLELHGLQVFVNLPANLKLSPPQVLSLDGADVPEWRSPDGSRVRVVVGRFLDQVSPLRPTQPFRWLDLNLRGELEIDVPMADRLLAYVVSGQAQLQREGATHSLTQGGAMVLLGTGRALHLHAAAPAQLMLLSGPAIQEPMVGNGPFVMADSQQLQDAMHRYQSGEMGWLEPVRR